MDAVLVCTKKGVNTAVETPARDRRKDMISPFDYARVPGGIVRAAGITIRSGASR
jgi:hypothetical protein